MPTIDSIDVTKYVDIPIFGAQYENTGRLQLQGIEAIKNTMKMYLLSSKGDYGRVLNRGGPLFDMIGKELTDSNKGMLASRITTALEQYTNITLNTLDISLDLVNKMFIVQLNFSDTYNKFIGNISLGVQGS